MARSVVARFVVPVLVVADLVSGPAVSAFASPGAGAKLTARHWIGTWSGKVSERPQPPPGDPQNPYKVVVTIRSVTKHTIGTARYPAWRCSYKLLKRKATPGKIGFLMKVVHPGPFNCVGQETVVLRKTAKGASFKGTAGSATETGSVRKS